jgi:hypothetical protein
MLLVILLMGKKSEVLVCFSPHVAQLSTIRESSHTYYMMRQRKCYFCEVGVCERKRYTIGKRHTVSLQIHIELINERELAASGMTNHWPTAICFAPFMNSNTLLFQTGSRVGACSRLQVYNACIGKCLVRGMPS